VRFGLIRPPDIRRKALYSDDELFSTFAQPDGAETSHQIYTRVSVIITTIIKYADIFSIPQYNTIQIKTHIAP